MNTNLPDHTYILPNHIPFNPKWLIDNSVRPSGTLCFRGSFCFYSFSLFVRTYRERNEKKDYTFTTTLFDLFRECRCEGLVSPDSFYESSSSTLQNVNGYETSYEVNIQKRVSVWTGSKGYGGER
jgi:hypothetical protein